MHKLTFNLKIWLGCAWFAAFFIVSCEGILNIKEKPQAIERNTRFQIFLEDRSGYMVQLKGTPGVADADVLLKSKTLGIEMNLISDSTGTIQLGNALSDDYFISAVREMKADEMQQIIGFPNSHIKLKNTTRGVITLRADVDSALVVPMFAVATGSELVISEIYACGPPEAGLYYHDKYLEVYNQSDSTIYLDSLLIVVGGRYIVRDPDFVYSKNIWIFPGSGTEYPLEPGQFAVCAEDAIDHRINAPFSVDLSAVRFEFYKPESPDIDNPAIPNMIRILQVSGNDWLIGGEKDALMIARIHPDSLAYRNEHLLVPTGCIIDGVEYLDDPTFLSDKKIHESIDAGATGGIEFYTGKSMERIVLLKDGKLILKDDDNSSLDFRVIDAPTPEYHHQQ
ncbi:DUF4876 domain-containing protein [candidate division KSB1 bacterium]|nr:DUF4876 domain-containing protein [candidate division KSB1 bacterium]